jgi:hypothetical protein
LVRFKLIKVKNQNLEVLGWNVNHFGKIFYF